MRMRLNVERLCERITPTNLPDGFAESVRVTGLDAPTAAEVAPDGRIFIAEQGGELKVLPVGGSATTTALDLSSRLNTAGERGLLGLTFDPAFASNGFIYTYYTLNSPLINRISRFTVVGNSIDPASELVLADLDPLVATNHNGGALHFGTDGKLYVATGENANPPQAQSIANRHGKILRYNPDGTIPDDNPTSFAGISGNTTGANRAIYAVGLRNPFTFAVQPGTGLTYLNDVGQTAFEEINVLGAGLNYGWPGTEGTFDSAANPNFTQPIVSYAHGPNSTETGFAIAGGTFYNPANNSFPTEFTGDYFYADFVNRWINRYDPATGAVSNFANDLNTGGIIDLDVTAEGDLLYLARGSGGAGLGTLYQIRASTAPAISLQPRDLIGRVGQTATFSVGANGTAPLSFQWQRNGQNIPGATNSSYTTPTLSLAENNDTYRVIVTNPNGTVTSNTATLKVSADQPPGVVLLPAPNTPDVTLFTAGETFTFRGTSRDPEDGILGAASLSWRVDYLTGGAPARPLLLDTPGVDSITFTIPTVTPFTLTDVAYRVSFTATDSKGQQTTATRTLTPRTTTISILTTPDNVPISIDGQPQTGRIELSTVQGVQRQLSAPATFTVNGLSLNFAGWSDGVNSRTRTVAPTTALGLTARYTAPPLRSIGSSNSQVQLVSLQDGSIVRTLPLTNLVNGLSIVGEARVATADINGDQIPETIVGAGPGNAPIVAIFDGATGNLLTSALAFEASFTGGVFVAAGDFGGDGNADVVISPDEGGGPRVRIFESGNITGNVIADFFAIDDVNFRGGVRPAVGDINQDGRADLVVSAGFGGGPRIAGFNGIRLNNNIAEKLFGDFFAFESELRNGAFVALGDTNGDGRADLIVGAGPGGGPRVRVLDAASGFSNNPALDLANFFAGDINARGGIRVAASPPAADGRAGVLVGTAPGTPTRILRFPGATLGPTGTPSADLELIPFGEADFSGVFVG